MKQFMSDETLFPKLINLWMHECLCLYIYISISIHASIFDELHMCALINIYVTTCLDEICSPYKVIASLQKIRFEPLDSN